MSKLRCVPLLALLAAPAQGAESSAEDMVVVASRQAVAASTVGASLTVITREALQLRQHTLVADALRETPGLAVSRGGGMGATTQVRMRGAEGNHTLVLIDGVEANNPVSNSEFDFANLLVADIERIEILRGPQSALHGSDAVGGVINVITRRPSERLRAQIHAETGTLATHKLGFSLASAGDRAAGGFSLTRLQTDGSNISRFGSEPDGYRNDTLTLNGRIQLSDRIRVDSNARYIDSEQDFDSQDFSFPPSDTQGLVIDADVSGALEQWFARVQATIDSVNRWQHRVGISATQTHNRFFDGPAISGENEGTKIKLDIQSTLELSAEQSLTLALERESIDYRNRGADVSAAENQSRSDEQLSLVGEYRRRLGRVDLSLSARSDDNELFRDASTYRITASIAANTRTRVHASFGTGVANPGFFELFGFFPDSFNGNPDLRPEHSRSFDVGVEAGLAGGLALDVTYFHADLEDEIQTVFDSETFLSTVVNLPGHSERRGIELTLDAAPSEWWSVGASFTYTDAEQADGLRALRRPRRTGSVNNTFQFRNEQIRVHLGLRYSGEQLDSEFVSATPATRVELSPFTLLDLAAEYTPSSRWRVYARIENLLDEEYEEWFSYRGRGRTASAGFELRLR